MRVTDSTVEGSVEWAVFSQVVFSSRSGTPLDLTPCTHKDHQSGHCSDMPVRGCRFALPVDLPLTALAPAWLMFFRLFFQQGGTVPQITLSFSTNLTATFVPPFFSSTSACPVARCFTYFGFHMFDVPSEEGFRSILFGEAQLTILQNSEKSQLCHRRYRWISDYAQVSVAFSFNPRPSKI